MGSQGKKVPKRGVTDLLKDISKDLYHYYKYKEPNKTNPFVSLARIPEKDIELFLNQSDDVDSDVNSSPPTKRHKPFHKPNLIVSSEDDSDDGNSVLFKQNKSPRRFGPSSKICKSSNGDNESASFQLNIPKEYPEYPTPFYSQKVSSIRPLKNNTTSLGSTSANLGLSSAKCLFSDEENHNKQKDEEVKSYIKMEISNQSGDSFESSDDDMKTPKNDMPTANGSTILNNFPNCSNISGNLLETGIRNDTSKTQIKTTGTSTVDLIIPETQTKTTGTSTEDLIIPETQTKTTGTSTEDLIIPETQTKTTGTSTEDLIIPETQTKTTGTSTEDLIIPETQTKTTGTSTEDLIIPETQTKTSCIIKENIFIGSFYKIPLQDVIMGNHIDIRSLDLKKNESIKAIMQSVKQTLKNLKTHKNGIEKELQDSIDKIKNKYSKKLEKIESYIEDRENLSQDLVSSVLEGSTEELRKRLLNVFNSTDSKNTDIQDEESSANSFISHSQRNKIDIKRESSSQGSAEKMSDTNNTLTQADKAESSQGISSLRTTLPSNSQQPPSLDSQNTPANSIQDTESLSMPIINENWAPSLSTNEPSCSTTISTTTTSTIKLSAEFKKRSGLNVIPAARMSQFGIASTQPSIDQPIAPAPVAATTSVLDQPKVSHTAAVSTAATTFPASNLATQANLKHAAAMVKSPLDLMQHYQQSNIGTLHYKPPFTQQGQLRPNQNRAMHIAPVLLQPSVNPNFQDQRQGILTGLHAQTQLRPTGQQALQGQVRSSGQHVLQGQIRQSGPHVLQGQIRPSGSHVLQGQIGPSGPHAKAQVGPTGIYVPQSLAFPNRHPYVPISNQPLMSNPAMQIRTPHHQQNMLVQQFSNTNTSDVNLRAGPNISLPQSSAIHYSHNQPGRQILATPSQPSPGQSINVSSTSAEEISNCFLCGKTATIKCCNLFVYCSQSCKDWDSSRHKSECEARR